MVRAFPLVIGSFQTYGTLSVQSRNGASQVFYPDSEAARWACANGVGHYGRGAGHDRTSPSCLSFGPTCLPTNGTTGQASPTRHSSTAKTTTVTTVATRSPLRGPVSSENWTWVCGT